MNYERKLGEPVRVLSRPGIMGGMPCISGTRVPAETIRQYLVAGDGKHEIYADYPYLPAGAVEAVIEWCRDNGLECTSS
jgi:uncharacterized protein (DUF433 family)